MHRGRQSWNREELTPIGRCTAPALSIPTTSRGLLAPNAPTPKGAFLDHYVLVPGMCHGAWCFDDLAASLRSAGHHVLAVTLTGVAERSHVMPGAVNLDTHIADVLAAI